MTNLDQRVFVAGHRGMVGAALARELDRRGYRDHARGGELDLEARTRSTASFHHGGRGVPGGRQVGGILANQNHPVDFLYRNLMIQSNVIRAAAAPACQAAVPGFLVHLSARGAAAAARTRC